MTVLEIAAKIQEIRPNAIWILQGDTYEGLEWLDLVQSKPTAEELNLNVPA